SFATRSTPDSSSPLRLLPVGSRPSRSMPSCTYCITRSCLLSITLRTDESRDSPCNSLQEPGDQRFHAAKPTKDRYELEGDGPVIPHCYWSQEIMVTVVV